MALLRVVVSGVVMSIVGRVVVSVVRVVMAVALVVLAFSVDSGRVACTSGGGDGSRVVPVVMTSMCGDKRDCCQIAKGGGDSRVARRVRTERRILWNLWGGSTRSCLLSLLGLYSLHLGARHHVESRALLCKIVASSCLAFVRVLISWHLATKKPA